MNRKKIRGARILFFISLFFLYQPVFSKPIGIFSAVQGNVFYTLLGQKEKKTVIKNSPVLENMILTVEKNAIVKILYLTGKAVVIDKPGEYYLKIEDGIMTYQDILSLQEKNKTNISQNIGSVKASNASLVDWDEAEQEITILLPDFFSLEHFETVWENPKKFFIQGIKISCGGKKVFETPKNWRGRDNSLFISLETPQSSSCIFYLYYQDRSGKIKEITKNFNLLSQSKKNQFLKEKQEIENLPEIPEFLKFYLNSALYLKYGMDVLSRREWQKAKELNPEFFE